METFPMTVLVQVKQLDPEVTPFRLDDADWHPWINTEANDDIFKRLVLNKFLREAGYQTARSIIDKAFPVTVFTRDLGQPNDVTVTVFEVSPKEKS